MKIFESNYTLVCCFHLDDIYVLLYIKIRNNKVSKSDRLESDYLLVISRSPKNFKTGEGKSKCKAHPRTGHEDPESE